MVDQPPSGKPGIQSLAALDTRTAPDDTSKPGGTRVASAKAPYVPDPVVKIATLVVKVCPSVSEYRPAMPAPLTVMLPPDIPTMVPCGWHLAQSALPLRRC
jgi:hypothetical protein